MSASLPSASTWSVLLSLFVAVSRPRPFADPGSVTCNSFNMLKLPRYPSQEMLEDKLKLAIRHGNHQFTLT